MAQPAMQVKIRPCFMCRARSFMPSSPTPARGLRCNANKAKMMLQEKSEMIRGKGKEDPVQINRELRSMSWECIGLVRTQERLDKFGKYLEQVKQQLMEQRVRSECARANRDWLLMIQNQNLYEIARAVHSAATERKESRGAHFRYDYKKPDDKNWTQNIFLRLKGDEIIVSSSAANNYKGRTPSLRKREYGTKGA